MVLEAGGAPGGVARTIRLDGYTVEPAVGAVMAPHPALSSILAATGAGLHPAVDATVRYVHTGDGLVPVTASPGLLLTPLVGWRGKLRAIAEPLVRTPALDRETLGAFLRRRFGRDAGDILATVMAAGVYGGDPERLSAAAAVPVLASWEGEHGSVIGGALKMRRRRRAAAGIGRPALALPDGGMSGLVGTLAGHLGERLRLGCTVRRVTPDGGGGWLLDGEVAIAARAAVLAVAPYQAAPLLGGDLEGELSGMPAAPVAVVALGGTGDRLPAGFGYLVAPRSHGVVAGCLFESSYAPERAPSGHWLAKVIAGGALAPHAVDLDDEALVAAVLDEVRAALGADLAPDLAHVVRHIPGIPQYDVGHRRRLAAVGTLLARRPGLHLTGWGYRGRRAGPCRRRRGAGGGPCSGCSCRLRLVARPPASHPGQPATRTAGRTSGPTTAAGRNSSSARRCGRLPHLQAPRSVAAQRGQRIGQRHRVAGRHKTAESPMARRCGGVSEVTTAQPGGGTLVHLVGRHPSCLVTGTEDPEAHVVTADHVRQLGGVDPVDPPRRRRRAGVTPSRLQVLTGPDHRPDDGAVGEQRHRLRDHGRALQRR